jgi:hypothetical protein
LGTHVWGLGKNAFGDWKKILLGILKNYRHLVMEKYIWGYTFRDAKNTIGDWGCKKNTIGDLKKKNCYNRPILSIIINYCWFTDFIIKKSDYKIETVFQKVYSKGTFPYNHVCYYGLDDNLKILSRGDKMGLAIMFFTSLNNSKTINLYPCRLYLFLYLSLILNCISGFTQIFGLSLSILFH